MRRMRKLSAKDRVGLGWRPELAAGIFDALHEIDVLEVTADNYLETSRAQRQALRILARDVPVHVHSIELGMAGSEAVNPKRLDRLARLVNEIEPEDWSEHLAFTRAGGIEIGHMAAPPRTAASVDNTVANLRRAAAVVGAMPMMENIATLIDPPCSSLSEQAWITQIVRASGCGILLDLHNLHANAVNFSFDPLQFLAEIPLERIGCIHVAGGTWVSSPDGVKRYRLDDHLHPVEQPVYALLAEVAARCELVGELAQARAALAAGRRSREALAHAG
jgi:uncharacterized protein (UPF0276 family)